MLSEAMQVCGRSREALSPVRMVQVANARFQGAKLEGSDWTDVPLRKDQITYLCKLASGTNAKTGSDTRESMMCP